MSQLLQLRGLTKVFPGVVALSGVDLDVAAGEVHCLVGQNGAGKSTLIKCVSGAVAPTSGTIEFLGQRFATGRPSAALSAGVGTIYQELDLVPELTVAGNIFLGHEVRVGPFLDRRAMGREVRELLGRLGHPDVDPDALVGDLRPAGKQLVSMARALSRNVRLLIMDEPSAILDPPEVEALFQVVRRLTAQGVGVIYISHRMDEIARIGDRVTVLRDGKTTASNLPATTPVDELIRFMVGRSFGEVFPRRAAPRDEVVLRVAGLSRPPHVQAASFEVRAGEILGIGGLVGAGRTELLRAIAGVDRAAAGEVWVAGQPLRRGRPDLSVAAGIGMAPEERKSLGLWLDWTQVRNVTISDLGRYARGPFTSDTAERRAAEARLRELAVRPDDPMRVASELSGGNQQKVVLARWLLHSSKVLLLDEPTRGVDVGAKSDVYRVVSDLAARGLGIVMVSSELAELAGFCDRILVMREGALVAELGGERVTEEEILRQAVRIAPGQEGRVAP
ncbi:MAG TPA: sugar ABC transporter ATP-binding protein [Kofleriaceae bacterium]|nr:sugar ABC transporter ATP-binding protein [Kofleriaceae bacterium]